MAPSPQNLRSDDYYNILGVSARCSEADIVKTYKKLALKHHPDKNPQNREKAEEEFKRITEAYEVLHDPQKRRCYDKLGKEGLQCPSGQQGGAAADDFFDMMFSSGGRDPFASFSLGGDRFGSSLHMFDDADFLGGDFGIGRRRSQARKQRVAIHPIHALPKDSLVVVRGLGKCPEHNGCSGRVQAWDEEKSRYKVELENRTCVLMLRPHNITQRCSVEVVDLDSKPELIGKMGEVLGYDEDTQRYHVRFQDPNFAASLPRSKCLLSSGTRILLQGLSNEKFNGKMARIETIDRAAGRYMVQCESGMQIKVRFENVVC